MKDAAILMANKNKRRLKSPSQLSDHQFNLSYIDNNGYYLLYNSNYIDIMINLILRLEFTR